MNDIKDALTRVADASAPTPLALEHVRGRARQIRRRRTAGALAGTAAAVAVVAGLGVAVLPSSSHDDGRPPIAKTPTASATPTPTPTEAVDANAVGRTFAVTLDVPAEQTFGGEPQVPYWFDGSIIDTNGTATPLPDRPVMFAHDPASGDWVVVRQAEAHAELVRIDVQGHEVGDPVPTYDRGLAVGPGGELATLTVHNTSVTLTEGTRTLDLGAGFETGQIYGVLPNGDVLLQAADGSVEVAHLDVGQAATVPDAAAAVASSQSGYVAYGMGDGTWRAEDENGKALWTLDWAGVSSFSPDAQFVALAGDPQHRIAGSTDWDSEATSTIWLRKAGDLSPVAAFTAPEGGYFWKWTWDGDQLLATVFQNGTWSLVRLSADGFTVGRATGRPGGGEEPAYLFAAQ